MSDNMAIIIIIIIYLFIYLFIYFLVESGAESIENPLHESAKRGKK